MLKEKKESIRNQTFRVCTKLFLLSHIAFLKYIIHTRLISNVEKKPEMIHLFLPKHDSVLTTMLFRDPYSSHF